VIFWTLAGIFVLFVVFAFIRNAIYKLFRYKVCSICAAIIVMWVILLALKLIGQEIDTLLIAILMGQTVASVMYIFENKAKQSGKNNLLWLKVVITVIGTLAVYLVLTDGFSLIFGMTLGGIILLALFIYKGLRSSKKPINTNQSKFRKEIEKLEERLEHCCD